MMKLMESEYRPYTSDNDESDTDSDNFTDYSSDTNTASIADIVSSQFLSNVRTRTQQLSKTLASSAPLKDDPNAFTMEGVDRSKNINYGATKFATASRPQTTQIILQSQDRDRQAFPNPTDFTIHFPRTYKNVTNIDLANMNFLNTLLFFRDSRSNTYFDIIETGRRTPNLTKFPIITDSNAYKLRVKIREGSYNISTLQQELLYTLNAAPPFFYYPNGFSDFAPLFAASGSYALNFNAPGDYLYDTLNKQYITLKSIDDVILRYFSSVTGNQTRYTNTDILVAYYFPALKEAFLDQTQYSQLNTTINTANLLQGEDVYTRVIYNFQGLQDKVIVELINKNRTALDVFRNTLTYLTHPINNYTIRENTYNKHLVLSAPSLATSIKNTINLNASNTFINALNANNITLAQYNGILGSNKEKLATLSEMRDLVFTTMAEEFGVPFNSYDIDALFCNNTLFNIQNGYDACNVLKTYSLTSNVDIFPDYSKTAEPEPIQFLSMSNLHSNVGSSYNLFEINNETTFPLVFDVDSALFNDSTRAIFIKGDDNPCNVNTILKDDILNINPKKRSIDFLATIDSSKYAVFKFKSPCRQTIQIETLPIPAKYRYKNYLVSNFDKDINAALNKELEYKLPNIAPTPQFPEIPRFNYSELINNYATSNLKTIDVSFNETPDVAFETASEYTLRISESKLFFSFIGPLSSNEITTLNLTLQSTTSSLESDIVFTHYADRSAFIADSDEDQENPLYYKKQVEGGISQSNSEITLSNLQIRGGDQHYFIVRSKYINFTNTPFKIFAWYSDSNIRTISYDVTGNPSLLETPFYLQSPESNANMYKLDTSNYTNIDFFKNYDDSYIKLPYGSNLYADTNPENNAFNDPIIPGRPYEVPIGYDANGVSTDLTDYKGVLLAAGGDNQTAIYTSQTRFDPESGFVFKVGSADNYYSNSQYISSNLTNEIVSPFTNTPYKPTEVLKREYKIVHWNDSHYISPSDFDIIQEPSTANYSSNIKPINVNDIIASYKNYSNIDNNINIYNAQYDAQSNIKFGQGVAGFSFLPSDGEWDINTFMFKSAYFDQATDPNKYIKFIGIFDTTAVVQYNINSISLSNAACILSNTKRHYYSNSIIDYDKQLGAYHVFKKMSSEQSPFKYVERPCGGYTHSPTESIIQDRSYYSAIPFDENGNILTYFMPTGSHIAHEELFGNSIIADSVYMQNSNNWMMPNEGKIFLPDYAAVSSMTVPSYIKPVNYTTTSNLLFQSKYEQSVPIITPKIQYIKDLGFFDDQIALFKYDAFDLVPNADARLHSANMINGKPMLSFIKNQLDCFAYMHAVVREENPDGTVVRRTDNAMPDNFLARIQLSPLFNSATEEIIAWARNDYAKYIVIYGSHPDGNGNDIKILKLMDGTLTQPTLFIDYGYNHNYKVDNVTSDSLHFCVTNKESIMFISLVNNEMHFNISNTSIKESNLRFVRFKNENNPSYSTPKQHYCNIISGKCLFYIFNYQTLIIIDADNALYNTSLNTLEYSVKNYYNFVINKIISTLNLIIDVNDNIYFIDELHPFFLSYINNSTNRFNNNEWINNDNITIKMNSLNYAYKYIQSAFRFPYSALENNFDWAIIEENNRPAKFIFKWQKKNNYSEDSWDIYGNFQIGKDVNHKLQSYSQIFYPTIKIGMTKLKEAYNSMTDAKLLTNNYKDSLIITPSWGHSKLFLYNGEESFRNDLGKCSNFVFPALPYYGLGIYYYFENDQPFKWGQESNYIRADNKYNGYYFNSYVYNMTLSNTKDVPNSDYYHLAIRASLPSEGFQTLVRINAPNRLDFGFITMTDLIKEIGDIYTNPHKYNPDYLERLVSFNNRFRMSNAYFGDQIYSNYPGFPVTTYNDNNSNYFSNFYTAMSNYYDTYVSSIGTVNTINSNVADATSTNLKSYWADILPEYVIKRERPTDPVTFSPLFFSSLSDAYKNLDEEWGLGWNLGFPKKDLPAATVHSAENVYKILYETIYLRLADYQGNMNMIDKTARERLSNTNMGQGETKQYFAKLLLNSFGSYSSTAFQNPPSFNPPIGKLDKLRFQWIDPAGQVIDNNECDWNAVMRITEQIESATAESTFVSYK